MYSYFVSQILADLGDGNYQVNFMKKNGEGSYFWPEPADIHSHPHTDFVAVLSDPSMAEHKRMVVWQFNPEELQKVSEGNTMK